MQQITRQIMITLQEILGERSVALHEPQFLGNEKIYVEDCIRSTFVSSVGEYVDRFESLICEFTGAKYAVATVNGTSALHISLILSDVQLDDEVLVPSLTFVATANAVKYAGATPHFIESEHETLGVSCSELDLYLEGIAEIKAGVCFNRNTNRVIRAILPVHIFGHPCDINGIKYIAKKYCLNIVEDCAESLGSYYDGIHTGRFGKCGAISFNGNKIITTGGGGAIITDDDDIAKKARHITTTAKLRHPWEYIHDQVGYNYRLPNLNAAVGCAQLERLDGFLKNKRILYDLYDEKFSNIDGVRMICEPKKCTSNYWLQAIMLNRPSLKLRDEILGATNQGGYMTRPIWRPLHKLPMYRNCPRMDLNESNILADSLINLPSSSFLANCAN